MKTIVKLLTPVLLTLILSSCVFFSDPKFKVKVLENSGDSWENLVFFEYLYNIYGYDRDNMELKVYLEINHFVSEPLIANNMMFLGDQGNGNSWGGHVFVLNDEFKIVKSIDSVEQIRTFHRYNDTLIADSWAFYDGFGGISFIDINSLTVIKNYLGLSGTPSTDGKICGYKDKIYVGSEYHPFSNPINTTIFDANTLSVIETTDAFQKKHLDSKRSKIFIYKNQLWVSYISYAQLEVYDLDTNELLAEFDLKEMLGLDSEMEYGIYKTFEKNGKIYTRINNEFTEDKSSSLLCFNPETFELEKIIELPYLDGVHAYDGYRSFDTHPDYIYFNAGLNIYKFNITTGQVEMKIEAPSTSFES